MSELRSLVPVTDRDYMRIRDHIAACRKDWEGYLESGLNELTDHLRTADYVPVTSEQRLAALVRGDGALGAGEVLASSRLKETEAIIAKMRRFREPLRVMLDVWGYRVVVANEYALDAAVMRCAELWETPTPQELLLRNGQLQFDWRRDYRRRSHAGLSAATTAHYDQAIHLNRRAPFGIVEIQILTLDLFLRVHCDPDSVDSHDHFVARREALLRGDDR